MEEQKDRFALLDMMLQPVFCVKGSVICRANAAARQLLLQEGMSVLPLLETGAEEYAAMEEGCLYLTLSLNGQSVPASVCRTAQGDLFRLEAEDPALQALSLASGQLRKPLGTALTQTAALLENAAPEDLDRLARLNRSLYQILRILGNMSDAEASALPGRMETMDAPGVFREIFEKAGTLAARSGRTLVCQAPEETVYCLLDREQLERAVLNILSNALKFTPPEGTVRATLTRRGRTLVLTVQDSGSGIPGDVLGSLYSRHLRQPGIEDGRFGLGLGLRLVRTAAARHGGTLLISQPETGGTRIIMTLAIRQKSDLTLSSPLFPMDYAGGFDHSLVELSEVLPPDLFDGSF